MSLMQKLKELIKLSNLCNFQLFASSIEGKYQPSKTAKLLGGEKVNEPYIPCKNFEFLEENFSETIRCTGLKFSAKTKTVMPFQYSEFLFH